ncbi:MAG TPA: serine/threonine-protein kinase [Saprospiraceae bacterium]|nr:serine/threonine-protein kinase [Saprospiraceae bacterium]
MDPNSNIPATSTRLTGTPLILARLGWWSITILTFIDLSAALYTIFIEKPVLEKPLWFLYDDEIARLNQLGISPDFYVGYITTLAAISVLMFFAVACLIFWRRSDDWQAILISQMGITIGIGTGWAIDGPLIDTHPNWLLLPVFISLIPVIGGVIIFFTFPDGRFIPGWTRWLVLPLSLFFLGISLIAPSGTNVITKSIFFTKMGVIAFSVLAQVYRYRRFSTQFQRQQTKWIIYGFILMILTLITHAASSPYYFPRLDDLSAKIYFFVYLPIIGVIPYYFPLFGIVFSVLRYRLWDIDFIINRSLVYGVLTALLVTLFGGSLFMVSWLFQNFSGGPIVAVAVSAAIFGFIFQPTRRQVQRFVDQRFYRIEIDYQKTQPDLPNSGKTEILRHARVGIYENLELIGRGGMADVYKSTHPTLGTPVAIKILPERLSIENEFRRRFAREALVISKLQHPNIVRIFDSGEQNGRYYMVMEYLPGRDLDQLIKNNGKLSLTQALPLIQQIASALDYAHAQGFVHRDIKPSNVLLDSHGTRAVLTDFGIAKITDAHTVMTITGYMLGTFDYIAPEQIQESAHVDGKADIYALGVMVYQMLTGVLPFKHVNPGALLIAHMNQPAPNMCETMSDIPYHVGSAVQRAMAKKPEERFATATEFAMEINNKV